MKLVRDLITTSLLLALIATLLGVFEHGISAWRWLAACGVIGVMNGLAAIDARRAERAKR